LVCKYMVSVAVYDVVFVYLCRLHIGGLNSIE
jgi:hypothetical protein